VDDRADGFADDEEDVVARFDGDQLLVVVDGLHSPADATLLGEELTQGRRCDRRLRGDLTLDLGNPKLGVRVDA